MRGGIRYAVVVMSPDGNPRVYGTFRDRARADALVVKISRRVDAFEAEEAERDPGALDMPLGWATVRIVHRSSGIQREAVRFATTGDPNPSGEE